MRGLAFPDCLQQGLAAEKSLWDTGSKVYTADGRVGFMCYFSSIKCDPESVTRPRNETGN